MENNVISINIEKMMFTAQGKINLLINTEITLGEFVALYGQSGAGKTTLLRILSGLTKPKKGFIKFGETVWFDSSKKINLTPQERNISYMFQDYALFPNMTVIENILYAQTKKNNEEALELLTLFGLSEFCNCKPNGLSGGQKQRVALARSLARKPKLLLLDEPLSALDTETRTALQNEILKAHKILKATTIMVSHDVNEINKLANHVMLINKGLVQKIAKPSEAF